MNTNMNSLRHCSRLRRKVMEVRASSSLSSSNCDSVIRTSLSCTSFPSSRHRWQSSWPRDNAIRSLSTWLVGPSQSPIAHGRNIHLRPRRNLQRHTLSRRLSSSTDDRTAENSNCIAENNGCDIVSDASDILLLEKAAFAARQNVEYGVVRSIETAVWKTSGPLERRKMGRFFTPRLLNATAGLLSVTSDTDSLSLSIEEIHGKQGWNAASQASLRELHRAFLNLTQILLDHLEVEEGDQDGNGVSQNSVQLLESALALSYRAHQLSLAYHWPLYQRLAMVVAKYPVTIGETNFVTIKTLGLLAHNCRAEWVQRIHRWAQMVWGDETENNGKDRDMEARLRISQKALEWFHPLLKVLASDERWSDVWLIMIGLCRTIAEPEMTEIGKHYNEEYHPHDSMRRNLHHINPHDDLVVSVETDVDTITANEHGCASRGSDLHDEDIVLSPPTIFPYMEEGLVFDLLVPMDQQGYLKELWDNKGDFPPPKTVEQTCDIVLMMEASIWKLFGRVPNHVKTRMLKSKECSERYSLQDAIKILVEYGSRNRSNLNIADRDDDEEEEEYSWDDNDKDSLTQALKDLETLLDEHIASHDDDEDESENDGMTEQASDAICLANTLSNRMRKGDVFEPSSGDPGTLRTGSQNSFGGETEVCVRRSENEHVMGLTNVGDESHISTEEYLEQIEEEECLDFIYDHRAVDYRDNIPDIASQIYQNNGHTELRYSSSFESHIYEGMQSRLDYDSEDDEDIYKL